eukprot:scaffold63482_cov44-Phaeocystis_antarctica.AAC.4
MAIALEVYAAVLQQRHAPHGLLRRHPLLEEAGVRRQPCERRLLALALTRDVGIGAERTLGVALHKPSLHTLFCSRVLLDLARVRARARATTTRRLDGQRGGLAHEAEEGRSVLLDELRVPQHILVQH